MALRYEKAQAACPPGTHIGIITSAEEGTRDFGKGAQARVIVSIAPKWRRDATTETLPLEWLLSPSLNSISQLSQFLQRMGAHPALGEEVDLAALEGREIQFDVTHKNGFPNVVAASVVPFTRIAPETAAPKTAKK